MDGQATRRRRQSPLHALYAANAISFVGNNLTNIAIPWFVLVTTGSAAKTGVTLFFSITPGADRPQEWTEPKPVASPTPAHDSLAPIFFRMD